MILIIAVVLGATFFDTLLPYICGRIVLPEMGLTAPGYWIWFWVSVFTTIFVCIVASVKEWLNS